MAKLLCRKKICGRCKKLLPVKSFGICRARKDKRNFYCKACVLEKVHAHREAKRTMKAARRRAQIMLDVPERKPCVTVGPPSLKERIKEAIKSGCRTRDEIFAELQHSTKVGWDELGDALADLAFQSHEVRVIRIGTKRELRLAA